MRDFKELLTGQGEDLFHKNMRKFGATVVESHQAFKDIKEGGNGGSAEEKLGMVYVIKADILALFDFPAEMEMSKENFIMFWQMIGNGLPFVIMKGIASNPNALSGTSNLLEDISEGRFTFADWNASALDTDRLVFYRNELQPWWKTLAPTLAEAKAALPQVFPNQMTEAEFFA